MRNVEYLVGSEQIQNDPMQPFNDEVCAFLHTTSSILMKSSREYPDVLSFAYWCRKANIQKLKAERHYIDHSLGYGLSFHITPGNIPVNFAFSFAFALLAGNSCIVRVPSKPFVQVTLFTDAVLVALEKHSSLTNRIAFIRYPIDNEVTAYFSAMADVRVIWGGDSTVALLKTLPSKPRCIDVAFSDRYSICLIDGKAVSETDDKALYRLTEQFYNDTYLMDQNACSSPQLVLWQNDMPQARERFWNAVLTLANKRYDMQASLAVDKYTKLCEDAINEVSISNITRQGNMLYRIELSKLGKDVALLRGKGGYFYEYSLQSWEELTGIVSEKYQTLLYFGIEAEELQRFVLTNHLRGIDRIVPIGKAMDIGLIWDGYDLISTMSRVVALR